MRAQYVPCSLSVLAGRAWYPPASGAEGETEFVSLPVIPQQPGCTTANALWLCTHPLPARLPACPDRSKTASLYMRRHCLSGYLSARLAR